MKLERISYISGNLKNVLYFQKWNFLVSYFSYISEGNFPSSQNKRKHSEKFLIFREMELSSPNHKKRFIFQEGTFRVQKTKTSYISLRNFFSISSNSLVFYINLYI